MGGTQGVQLSVGAEGGYLSTVSGNTGHAGAVFNAERRYSSGNYWKADATVGNVIKLGAQFGHTFNAGKNTNVDAFVSARRGVGLEKANVGEISLNGMSHSVDAYPSMTTVGLGCEVKQKTKIGTFGVGAKTGYDFCSYNVNVTTQNGTSLVDSKQGGLFVTPTISYASPEIGKTGLQIKANADKYEGSVGLIYNIPHRKK